MIIFMSSCRFHSCYCQDFQFLFEQMPSFFLNFRVLHIHTNMCAFNIKKIIAIHSEVYDHLVNDDAPSNQSSHFACNLFFQLTGWIAQLVLTFWLHNEWSALEENDPFITLFYTHTTRFISALCTNQLVASPNGQLKYFVAIFLHELAIEIFFYGAINLSSCHFNKLHY